MMNDQLNITTIYALYTDTNVGDEDGTVRYYKDFETAKHEMYGDLMVAIEKLFGSVNQFLKNYQSVNFKLIDDDYAYVENDKGQKYCFSIDAEDGIAN